MPLGLACAMAAVVAPLFVLTARSVGVRSDIRWEAAHHAMKQLLDTDKRPENLAHLETEQALTLLQLALDGEEGIWGTMLAGTSYALVLLAVAAALLKLESRYTQTYLVVGDKVARYENFITALRMEYSLSERQHGEANPELTRAIIKELIQMERHSDPGSPESQPDTAALVAALARFAGRA